MLRQRLLWGGTTITSLVMGYLAYVKVESQLARWAFCLVFGLLFIASMVMFPWGQNDDGSPRRLLNYKVCGRNNPSFVAADSSTVTGPVLVTGRGTVHQHGLTVEQMGELKKHVGDQVAGEVERYVDRRMEVFKEDVAKNQGQAFDQAMMLANQLLTNFVEQLAAKAPENIESLKTVAMQQAILHAQTSAAVADDEDLTETLVDILIDKSGAEPRSFKGVVLTQALDVAGKLTADQVNLLTAIVIITHTVRHTARTEESAFDWLDAQCRPLYGKIPDTNSAIQYMSYTGVGSVMPLVGDAIASIIVSTYDAVFTNGFNLEGFRVKTDLADAEEQLAQLVRDDLVIPLNPEKPNYDAYRFNLASSQTLDNLPPQHPLWNSKTSLKKLITENRIPRTSFETKVNLAKPELADFLKALDNISAASFRLSTVGIALGQANWRRLNRDAPDVDIYLV